MGGFENFSFVQQSDQNDSDLGDSFASVNVSRVAEKLAGRTPKSSDTRPQMFAQTPGQQAGISPVLELTQEPEEQHVSGSDGETVETGSRTMRSTDTRPNELTHRSHFTDTRSDEKDTE